jgi:glycosyltransferase involved in cell wall biosynthesis
MIVSIVTCTYNSEKTISQTLNSIRNQTSKNFELIIIDGGSTDKTLEILKNYSDIISLIISELDNGVYDAMNKGIMNSSGDIIGFLNSDDFYYHNKVIENIIAAFSERQVEIYYSDMNIAVRVFPKLCSVMIENYCI